MFAKRVTALIDACVLAGALKRNLILTLAEAEFFRVRWSGPILGETRRAIAEILVGKGVADAAERAERATLSMETAFEDACVIGFEGFLPICRTLPDPGDAHVLAAALKTQASIIVTDNLRHFPNRILSDLNVEAKSADAFIADTIDLNPARAIAAIRTMRLRLRKPEKTAEALLLDMDANGLSETVDGLRTSIDLM